MKQAFALVVFIFSCFAMQAQETDGVRRSDKKIQTWFAIHAGLNYSGIEGETDLYKGFIPGFTAGVRLSVLRLSESVRINLEANYSEQGGKYTIDNDDAPPGLPRTGKLRLYYVNFPATLRYQGKGGFYCELGGQLGYLLNAADKYNGSSTDVKNDHNKIDYDVLGGLGFRISKNWSTGFRVVPGLRTINKKLSGVEVNSDRNMVATAMISYHF